jgi:hypothetical protein
MAMNRYLARIAAANGPGEVFDVLNVAIAEIYLKNQEGRVARMPAPQHVRCAVDLASYLQVVMSQLEQNQASAGLYELHATLEGAVTALRGMWTAEG